MCCFNNVKCNPGLLLFNHPVMSDSLCPMDCSMPGLSVLHHLLECAQVHVHCIGDAIQSSHPLTPSSSALNLSLHTLLAWEMSAIVQWLYLQTWGTHLLVSYFFGLLYSS